MSEISTPAIRKARLVTGKTLSFRDVSADDAAFVINLRIDEKKSRHLSKVSPDVSTQRAWLERYRLDASQAYFIIEHKATPIGTVRLYDQQGESFCWGSWILIDACPSTAALESALMVYAYAQDFLKFESAHFDVRIANERVWRFHERFGAIRIGENGLDYFYRLSGELIRAARLRYARFLPDGVSVDP